MGAKRSILRACLAAMGTAGGGGTVFLQETFTGTPGTAITALTPTTGGAWSVQTGSSPASPNVIDTAGTALYSQTTQGVYQNAATPPSADYYVEAVMVMRSVAAGDNISITARADPAANTLYFGGYSQSSAGWRLFKVVAGTATQLGTTHGDTWTSGTRTPRLTVTGTSISLSVPEASINFSATDSAITAAGKAGIRMVFASGPSAGIHMASIVAST